MNKIRLDKKVEYYEDDLLFKIKGILRVSDDNDILPYLREVMEKNNIYREKDEVIFINFS